MSFTINIGPVSPNNETQIKLAFGKNVSAARVLSFVEQSAHEKEEYGLISNQEADEMIKETEEKLKDIHFV